MLKEVLSHRLLTARILGASCIAVTREQFGTSSSTVIQYCSTFLLGPLVDVVQSEPMDFLCLSVSIDMLFRWIRL